MPSGDETLPLGDPPIPEHQTQSGLTELAQRLIAFPFTPPDVNLKQNDGLSTSNDWFTKHDKNKIDELGMIGFYASSGPQSVGVVPKLDTGFLNVRTSFKNLKSLSGIKTTFCLPPLTSIL